MYLMLSFVSRLRGSYIHQQNSTTVNRSCYTELEVNSSSTAGQQEGLSLCWLRSRGWCVPSLNVHVRCMYRGWTHYSFEGGTGFINQLFSFNFQWMPNPNAFLEYNFPQVKVYWIPKFHNAFSKHYIDLSTSNHKVARKIVTGKNPFEALNLSYLYLYH